ncbi:hypothetical protein ACQ4LE_004893 [Meloidogyne hapla]|uniref:Asp_Arg_Hydrox domain-containing protein n=1 Tax=Meloidogyne hapla TaxID=6305 RepID=A0A1I8B2D4_MELHA
MYFDFSSLFNELLNILLLLLLSIGPLCFYFLLAIFSHNFIRRLSSSTTENYSKTEQKFDKKELISAYSLFKSINNLQNFKRIDDALKLSLQDNAEIFFRMNLREFPIWEENDLPNEFIGNVNILERNYKMIVKEMEKAFKCGHLWIKNENIYNKTNWFTYFLIKDGNWQEECCNECPELVKLLKEFDNDYLLNNCSFCNVNFSMLPANSAIPEHIGTTNIRLRIHYGLEIPSGNGKENCFMKVGNKKFYWTAGKATIINTSFLHSVSSIGCSEDRIVLIIDFWHPDLTKEEKEILKNIFPPITK